MSIAKHGFAMAWAAVVALAIAHTPALAGVVGPQSVGTTAETLLLVEAGKQQTARPQRAIRRTPVNRGVAARRPGSFYTPGGKGGLAPPHFDDQFVLDP
jgi:hypothetical protein